jgi:hypothetical protein
VGDSNAMYDSGMNKKPTGSGCSFTTGTVEGANEITGGGGRGGNDCESVAGTVEGVGGLEKVNDARTWVILDGDSFEMGCEDG